MGATSFHQRQYRKAELYLECCGISKHSQVRKISWSVHQQVLEKQM